MLLESTLDVKTDPEIDRDLLGADTHKKLNSLATLTASLALSSVLGTVWLAAFYASFSISKWALFKKGLLA